MPDPVLANAGQRPQATTNIALLGFGTVGSSFAEVLAAASRPDLRITHVFNRGIDRKRAHRNAKFLPEGTVWTESIVDVLTAPDVHVIIELIGGLTPIEDYLVSALSQGKHVITANKQLIAQRGPALFRT